MPIDTDWANKVETEEDAVKRVLKRIKRLNEGVLGDLEKLHNNCRKQIQSGHFNEHVPACFVRYLTEEQTPDGKDKEEVREFFYVCSNCLSKYILSNPSALDNFTILRGKVSGEAMAKAQEYYRQRDKEENKQ